MKRVARFFEDKFISVFAPESEDQELADDFDRDLFDKSIKHLRFHIFVNIWSILLLFIPSICMYATESEST